MAILDAKLTFGTGGDQHLHQARIDDRPVADFEATLAALTSTNLKVTPHIVIGLHYGKLLGEQEAGHYRQI